MTNEITTINSNSSIASLPLSREEMAMYVTYLDDSMSKYINVIQKQINEQNALLINALNKVVESCISKFDNVNTILENVSGQNTNVSEAIRESTADLKNVLSSSVSEAIKVAVSSGSTARNGFLPVKTSKFSNTLSYQQTAEWIQSVWAACDEIGKATNRSKTNVISEVYKQMRKSGVDVDDLYAQWRETDIGKYKVSKINMCTADSLRPQVDAAIKVLKKTYHVKSKNVPMSIKINKCPLEIRNLIFDYSKKKAVNMLWASRILYKKLGETTNSNMTEDAKEYAKSIGYASCGVGYYISTKKELVSILRQIVKED